MKKEKDDVPEIDVSLLTEEQKREYYKKPKILPWVIVFASFFVIILVLVIGRIRKFSYNVTTFYLARRWRGSNIPFGIWEGDRL